MRRPFPSAVAAVLLLAVGPLTGTGGQAQAGFVGMSVDAVEAVEAPRWASLVQEFLTTPDLAPRTQPAEQTSTAPAEETPRLPMPTTPRENASHGDTGSSSSSPTGSVTTSVPVGHLGSRPVVPPLTLAGLLFLQEAADRSDLCASRLFRPPRS